MIIKLPNYFNKQQSNINNQIQPLVVAVSEQFDTPFTIAYFTCRKDPKIEWFFRSLNRELKNNWKNVNIIIIDYYYQFDNINRKDEFKNKYEIYTNNVKHISPKPSPIQGKYKVTKDNYFAASSARNTAFINCETSYIVCIDDLTVVKEGWLDVVLWGVKNNYVVYGSYAKVNKLECLEDGSFSFDKDSIQLDSRFNNQVINNDFATRVAGSWLFGCSFAMPLKLAFKIDGFSEICDTIGSEDSEFGIRLNRVTTDIYYSRQMMTLEDDLLHFTPGNIKFIRESKILTENTLMKNKIGLSSDHAIIQNVMESDSPLPFIPTNLSKIKEIYNLDESKVAESFDTLQYWVDGKLFCEM